MLPYIYSVDGIHPPQVERIQFGRSNPSATAVHRDFIGQRLSTLNLWEVYFL